MSIITAPIHVAEINGHPLRFYRSPAKVPDLPWCSAFDLGMVSGLTEDGAMRFCRDLWEGPYREKIARLATYEGPVVTIPNWMASTFFQAAAAPGMKDEYARRIPGIAAELVAYLPAEERFRRVAEMAEYDWQQAAKDDAEMQS